MSPLPSNKLLSNCMESGEAMRSGHLLGEIHADLINQTALDAYYTLVNTHTKPRILFSIYKPGFHCLHTPRRELLRALYMNQNEIPLKYLAHNCLKNVIQIFNGTEPVIVPCIDLLTMASGYVFLTECFLCKLGNMYHFTENNRIRHASTSYDRKVSL